mmetsp:Transcript_15132/g.25123  ORF Transcript_15132/g.25123 Transcript_15132/m.25123 type:complete len:142 (-) Transcript_15132:244-669(-)
MSCYEIYRLDDVSKEHLGQRPSLPHDNVGAIGPKEKGLDDGSHAALVSASARRALVALVFIVDAYNRQSHQLYNSSREWKDEYCGQEDGSLTLKNYFEESGENQLYQLRITPAPSISSAAESSSLSPSGILNAALLHVDIM